MAHKASLHDVHRTKKHLEEVLRRPRGGAGAAQTNPLLLYMVWRETCTSDRKGSCSRCWRSEYIGHSRQSIPFSCNFSIYRCHKSYIFINFIKKVYKKDTIY